MATWRFNAFVGGVLATAWLGCAGGSALDDEACELMKAGSGTEVRAAPTTDNDAPEIRPGTRYDVDLADGWYTRITSSQEGTRVFYLSNPDVVFEVRDENGQALAPVSESDGSESCAEVKTRHEVRLGVRRYYLYFGGRNVPETQLVVQEQAGSGG